ncbi:hypothetical protein QLX67_12620, partial [Balneolaceae bacterium ANBcel3]|nr:hypothetical protein [Balneolaceae bacterium ANBcel3]
MKLILSTCCVAVFFILSVFFSLNTAEAGEKRTRIIEDGGTGPHSAIMIQEPSLATHTTFVPEDLSEIGEDNKLPVIAWGNGACNNSPWEHVNFLNEIASHGFLVIAIGLFPEEGDEEYKGR